MDDSVIATSTVAWLAFGLALAFGFVSSRTNFCTMGAVSDIVSMGDWNRMRMWVLSMAVAILGTSSLHLAGYIDPADSIYTGNRLIWFSNLLGGLAFGVGMTLASGCGSKTLVRIGGGNLKSLVVFVFLGISAYITMRGLFAVWRVRYLDPISLELESSQALPALLNANTDLSAGHALLVATIAVGGGLLWFALSHRSMWRRDGLEFLFGGAVIGALVVVGWLLSGHFAFVAEHPQTLEEAFIGTNSGSMESFTFVAPIAYTLELLMFWSDSSRYVTIGIASVLGVISGAALHALLSSSFRIEGFRDTPDLVRHMIGGILMGFGGVTAFGCTIGQGITGISTLALGSFLSTLAIIAGSFATLKYQYWKMMRE